MSSKKLYTVFVGGTEVTDYYVTLENALELAKAYEEDGYTEVMIEARAD
jgi:hypothetical protein